MEPIRAYSATRDGLRCTVHLAFPFIKEVEVDRFRGTTSVLIDWPYGKEPMTFVLRGIQRQNFETDYFKYLGQHYEMVTDNFGIGRLIKRKEPDWEI